MTVAYPERPSMTPEQLYNQPFGLKQHLRTFTSPVYVVSDDLEGLMGVVAYSGPTCVIRDGQKWVSGEVIGKAPALQEILEPPSPGDKVLDLYYVLDDEWLQGDVLKPLIEFISQDYPKHFIVFVGGPTPRYEGAKLLPRIGEPLIGQPSQPNYEGWARLHEGGLRKVLGHLHLGQDIQPFKALVGLPKFQAYIFLSHAFILAKDLVRATTQGPGHQFALPKVEHVAEQLPRVIRDMAQINGWS